MSVDLAWLQAQADDLPIFASIHQSFLTKPPDRIAVAVSGGGDSIALLHAFRRYTQQSGQLLFAVTVNHGLRPEASDEAQFVADFCADHDVPHQILRWKHKAETGNLQDQARRARYDLIARWARQNKIGHVAIGHTATDQAETFLMRLARESGIDGLSGMRHRWIEDGVQFHRPFLWHTREELREFLVRHDVPWIDDPSNDDLRFERVKARKALDVLAPLGITVETLLTVTHHLTMERAVIQTAVLEAERKIMRLDRGDVLFDRKAFRFCQPELGRRLLVNALMWVSSSGYAPRTRSVERVLRTIRDGKPTTLAGCRILVRDNEIRISRELRAVRDVHSSTRQLWDGRWRLKGRHDKTLQVRALGPEGLRQCTDWKEQGLPRASLLATPAIWHGDTLIAAPVAGLSNGWTAQIVADFHDKAFAH